MSDNVQHILDVTGGDARERNRFAAAARGTVHWEGSKIEIPLSLEQLVPRPKWMTDPYSIRCHVVFHEVGKDLDERTRQELEWEGIATAGMKTGDELRAHWRTADPRAESRASAYHARLKRCGPFGPRSWCEKNWGTEGFSPFEDGDEWVFSWTERAGPKRLRYIFNTRWSPATRWLVKVSKQFPRLTFTMRWEELDGDNTGLLEIRRGRVVTDICCEMWGDEEDPDRYVGYVTGIEEFPFRSTPSKR